MLARNMLIWAMFRYINPDEILIDYLELFLSVNGDSFLKHFLCPCGSTLAVFELHWNLIRRK